MNLAAFSWTDWVALAALVAVTAYLLIVLFKPEDFS
ncbi:MAG: potassium-transporting ATPase subunit F [Proteobacteria bacterium]|nr:potassium-transporting ATPase subunit F [Burkholderiales bacterium]